MTPLSTWINSNADRISGSYSEADRLAHVTNSAGESWTETLSSWLDRLEAIRKDGWWQVA